MTKHAPCALVIHSFSTASLSVLAAPDGPVQDGPVSQTDLGALLRALRRAADLSQRQLAERASVPQSTVARIEAGKYVNPSFRTVEQIVQAAGGSLSISHGPAAAPEGRAKQAPTDGVDQVPHDHLTDAGGRRYPAHLDVRATFPMLGRDRKLLDSGKAVLTFHLERGTRDDRRQRAQRADALAIERDELAAGRAWIWTARTADGDIAATLAAQVWPRSIEFPGQGPDAVVCHLTATPAWRGSGVERRLIAMLRRELADRELAEVTVIAYRYGDNAYLRQFGFHPSTKVLIPLKINLRGLYLET